MLVTLALRHLLVRPLRAVVLLLGFALGVAVMIVLLSVGEAMLMQSRDPKLIGGGDITVLPFGIDVEAMRAGGTSGMFFGIDRARFLTRVLLGGPREAGAVRTVAPFLENKLVYVTVRGRTLPVRAGGEIPSRTAAVGAALDVLRGEWRDAPSDSAWMAPTTQRLYDELDRFHLPPRPDSTWAEWHYFNVVTAPDEWWYITYLVGGALPSGRWGGRLMVSHRRPDGRIERFEHDAPAREVTFDTARADLAIGAATVRQRDGRYQLRGEAGAFRVELAVVPAPRRWFPAVELRNDAWVSGYVVPGLRARATGRLCVAGRCTDVREAPAYHDHNWGVWRAVTWEWGAGQGASLDLLYGGVAGPGTARGGNPAFLALADSLGLLQVLRFRDIRYEGRRPADGEPVMAPERFRLVAGRAEDTVAVTGVVEHALATRTPAAGAGRVFLQLRARWRLAGRVDGRAVADSGRGFFETYIAR